MTAPKHMPSDAVVEIGKQALLRKRRRRAGLHPAYVYTTREGRQCEAEMQAILSALSDAGLAVTEASALRIANETATRALERENDWRKHLGAIQELAGEQAEDEALWCECRYISEAHLQQELRRLHEVIEGKTGAECAEEAMAAAFHTSQLETVCKTCGGTRIVPDGAHYSGLGKDYGGQYCPDCTGEDR